MRRLLLLLPLCLAPVLAHADTPAERKAAANHLLDALKQAPTEHEADTLEDQIRLLWLNAGTPAVSLLLNRGQRELKADADSDAIEDFSAAVTLDPTLAEGYHLRALARYHAGDTQGAIADIEAALRAEPRSFTALQTLTRISEAREDWKGAYAAWQKVLEIDPKTPGGEDRLKELKRKAFGEET